jgi:multiple sugar transport system permease protein
MTAVKTVKRHRPGRNKKIAIITSKYLVLVLLSLFFLFPFAIMVLKSFMDHMEATSLPPQFFPSRLYLTSYVHAIDMEVLRYLWNTVIVTFFGMFSGPLSASLVAFGFARVKFKGSKFWFAVVMSTMMIPMMILQIPLYVMYANTLGWIDTLYPMIVPGFFGGGAITIFLMRQFMRSIPTELDNAAKIDGANIFQIYSRVVLPLCKPIFLFFVIQSAIGVFNDFATPLLFIQDQRMFTMALGIYYKFSFGA